MKNFVFRFETLVKLHTSLRDLRQAQLSEAYQAHQILLDQRQQTVDDLQQNTVHTRQVSSSSSVDVDHLLNTNRYDLLLRAQLRQLEQQEQQLAAEIQRRRELLVEADRQVRSLEKLRQKQLAAHQALQLKQEIQEMDELALRRTYEDEA